jgi:hypothetical protein
MAHCSVPSVDLVGVREFGCYDYNTFVLDSSQLAIPKFDRLETEAVRNVVVSIWGYARISSAR